MKVGILSGTFDPVHEGHVAFALQAIEEAGLDIVYLAPEIMPRRKEHVTHIAHRAEMIRLAIAPHPRLDMLELPDRNFSTIKTLPRLEQHFPAAQLFYLCGSDMLEHMPGWEYIDVMLERMGLIVGVKSKHEQLKSEVLGRSSKLSPRSIVIKSPRYDVSSSQIRAQVQAQQPSEGLLVSTKEYINKKELYLKS